MLPINNNDNNDPELYTQLRHLNNYHVKKLKVHCNRTNIGAWGYKSTQLIGQTSFNIANHDILFIKNLIKHPF